MKLTFLGTSAGSPTAQRNMSSIVLDVRQERGRLWLFDCGEATQMQMQKAKFSLSKLEILFLTHLHGDHLFGLPGVLTSQSLMQNQSSLILVGPKGIKQFIETVIEISDSWLNYPLNIIELEKDCTVFEDNQFRVEAKLLQHRVPCFGYRILYNDLKKGRKLAILGDTIPCEASIELAKDVDVLVHEATQEHALADKAIARGHSTTTHAATIAKQANAKKLIMTHISPRYSLHDNDKLVSEAKNIFPNTEIATDFSTFEI
ncbi:hypothetical protein A9G45_00395 [Gilliamella sp. HK2]|jgi:ribonuclease Z|nr:ribonuclease Z [Gilliamella apicola]OCG26546.1 hypothetical protein A9G45_00395 [Gilliamella apicola]OCG26981.1 hypothetical protein A9G46_03925 [Gilliamella apicola]OCG61040.1 hypothetical protein A9G40_02140 [Gilliamella apicola]OCG71967.1 hypothetical protein A9G41_01670 [Gilliamella apicola]